MSAALLYASFLGAGPLPALGNAFNPETGAWTMGADAASYGGQNLHLNGLQKPAKVVLEANGTAHITASKDHDLFLAIGYVQAKFRLFQMDLLRRQGEGRLSEVLGRGSNDDVLNSDRFELQLGLLRTAQQEWAQLPADDEPSAAASLSDRLRSLPEGLIAMGGASNNWAVAGSRSASGGALMAGDPHLHLTLPAIWFQVALDSPGYHVAGVTIPGAPAVVIGHNQHISWSLTDAQNQQTFFYEEKEDKSHPNQYSWNGAWKQYTTMSYDIPVLGSSPDHLKVKLSVHGPVINERGLTTSVWWAGNVPSQDFQVLLGIDQANNFQEFRDALRDWYAPTHNFVYADDLGNIGLISAGYYPQVAPGCEPWLPMPGTGEDDVTGTIPYDQIPQAYNPPNGIVWSANQRQVAADYPYYIGTALNFFDPGYRATEILRFLNDKLQNGGKLTAADMMALQADTRDYLAGNMVPFLIRALAGQTLTGNDKTAFDELSRCDYRMDQNSTAASIS